MTLDETIEEFEAIAKKYSEKCKDKLNVMDMVNLPLQNEALDDFIKADAHKQVAEWLRELQRYRNGIEQIKERINNYKGCDMWGIANGMQFALECLEVKADDD